MRVSGISTGMYRVPRVVLAIVAGLVLTGCHPGNEEAKRLRNACDAGEAAACNAFAAKLQKGEYVLRDEGRAASLFGRACDHGVANGCSSLAVMLQTGSGVKRDSARAFTLLQQGCE